MQYNLYCTGYTVYYGVLQCTPQNKSNYFYIFVKSNDSLSANVN